MLDERNSGWPSKLTFKTEKKTQLVPLVLVLSFDTNEEDTIQHDISSILEDNVVFDDM